MCHTAKSDGHVDPSEAQTIASITSQLTGKSQNIDNIRIMIDQAVSNLQPHQFTAFGEGLSEDEKHLVLKASLMVAVADGKIEESEHTFVSNLAHAFRITGDQMRAMLHVIAPTRHTA
jgi:tellurite resistance protein